MRKGKLSEPILKRSVLKRLYMDSPGSGKQYGADCAIWHSAPGLLCAFASAGPVPGFEETPGQQVIAAANNLFAGGALPKGLMMHVLLPTEYEESALQADMRALSEAAGKYGMQILGGHTEVTDAVTRPQYLVTCIGETDEADCRAQCVLKSGQELVMTKWAGLGGTAALARVHEEELKQRFPYVLIDRAKEFGKLMSVEEEARAITHFGTAAMHDLSQGGIFGALWEMAERAGVGLEVELKKIPVKQETIEICEYFDINPYYLYSAGSLLAGTEHGEALVAELAARGISAAVIGRVTDGRDRIIRNGDEVRFLDRPQQDEWFRHMQRLM